MEPCRKRYHSGVHLKNMPGVPSRTQCKLLFYWAEAHAGVPMSCRLTCTSLVTRSSAWGEWVSAARPDCSCTTISCRAQAPQGLGHGPPIGCRAIAVAAWVYATQLHAAVCNAGCTGTLGKGEARTQQTATWSDSRAAVVQDRHASQQQLPVPSRGCCMSASLRDSRTAATVQC